MTQPNAAYVYVFDTATQTWIPWGGASGGATLGANTFTATQTIADAEPRIVFNETDAAANRKLWDLDVNAGVFSGRTRTDADGAGKSWITVTRGTTTEIVDILIGDMADVFTTYVRSAAGFIVKGQLPGFDAGQQMFIDYAPGDIPERGRIQAYNGGAKTLAFNPFGGDITLGDTSNATTTSYYQFAIGTIGKGLSIAEGANAKMGVAVLVGGTKVVTTTAVTANSRIFLTAQALGTVAVPSGYGVSARVAGTSFTILASVPTDTSTIAWMIVEPI